MTTEQSDAKAPELYRKYRPTKFSDVVGQREAVQVLTDLGRRRAVPHVLLFTGPSGTGKTSLARILRRKLGCGDRDCVEVNAAKERGIDMVRQISQRMGLSPLDGRCRVWIVDECHALTGDAQGSFLKLLEDTPSHVYFMLATTDPQKLKKTILTRCTKIACRELTVEELVGLVTNIAAREDVKLDEDVAEKIAETSDGSAREALVKLHAVIGLESVEDQIKAIERADARHEAKNICRAMFGKGSSWQAVAAILRETNGDAEKIRWQILGYSRAILLKGGPLAGRAAAVIEEFREPLYESKDAGLAASCYAVMRPSGD